MAKVLAYGEIDPDGRAVLAARGGIEIVTVQGDDPAGFSQEIVDADALILRYHPFGRADLERAEKLKVCARYGVGYDNIDMEAATEHGIPVAVVGEANSVAVAEHTFYLMLTAAKQGIRFDQAMRKEDWSFRTQIPAIELWRKTILIVGFGRIGTRVAARAAAFDMDVRVYDPLLPAETIRGAGFTPVDDLDGALADADYVTLHAPLTPVTRHMIDADALARMKPEAVLVNTARGGLVDEAALIESLGRGHLHGAGLDVFENEPAIAGNPLLEMPNTVLTPHIAGLTRECAARMSIVSAQNALDGIDGQLESELIVNPEVLSVTR